MLFGNAEIRRCSQRDPSIMVNDLPPVPYRLVSAPLELGTVPEGDLLVLEFGDACMRLPMASAVRSPLGASDLDARLTGRRRVGRP